MSILLRCLCVITAAMIGALLLSATFLDDCVCSVTNYAGVSRSGGTCTVTGQGPWPCFDFTLLSDVGTPEHGRCDRAPNCAVKNGAYTTEKFRITVAECAAECVDGKSSDAVTVQLHHPGLPVENRGTIEPGEEKVYEVSPPPGLSGVCGTWTSSSYLRFFNDRGGLLFEVRIDFGCANCLN